MKLIPLTEDKFDCLRPALEARITESNLQDRSNPDKAIRMLRAAYGTRCAGAYVDNTEDPKHVLIMMHFPGVDTFGLQAMISVLYIAPEERGNAANLATMLSAAENYAKINGAEYITGSSWTYRGAKASDSLWRANGFEPQETVYIKKI